MGDWITEEDVPTKPKKSGLATSLAREATGLVGGAIAGGLAAPETAGLGSVVAAPIGYAAGKQFFDLMSQPSEGFLGEAIKGGKYLGEGAIGEGMFRGAMKGAGALESGYNLLRQKGVRGVMEAIPQKWNQLKAAVPTPSAMSYRSAGAELAATAPKSAAEAERIARNKTQLENALLRVGGVLPEESAGNVHLAALARQRGAVNPKVAAVRQEQRLGTMEKAEEKVASTIPRNEKVSDLVISKIQAHNARQKQIEEAAKQAEAARGARAAETRATTLERANVARQQAMERTQTGAEAGLAEAIPQRQQGEAFKTPEQRIGAEIESAAEQAEEASMGRFSSTETGYNQRKFTNTGTTPAEPLMDFLITERPSVAFSKSVNPESKLASVFGGVEKEATEIPELSYSDLREISSEAASMARRFANTDRDASRYFGQLQDAAEASIQQHLASAGGKELAQEYSALNALYAKQQAGGFRYGEVGKLLKWGKELEGGNIPLEDIPKRFLGLSDADSLIQALGIAKLSERKGAEAMADLGAEELFKLGQPQAAKLMKPFIDDELARIYSAADNPVTAAKNVTKWLKNNQDSLTKYGLTDSYSGLLEKASKVTKANQMKLPMLDTKALPATSVNAARAELAANTIGVSKPDQVYNYIRKSKDIRGAVREILAVSPSSDYAAGVKALLRDGIRNDIYRGLNPFSKTPTAEERQLQTVMSEAFNKSERQTLLDLFTITEAAKTPTSAGLKAKAKGGAEGLEAVSDVVSDLPLGLFNYQAYWAKKGTLALLDKFTGMYQKAALKVLDDALVDPKIAKQALDAFKKGEIEEFMKSAKKAQSFMDETKKRGTSIVGSLMSARGASAVGSEKEKPDYEAMSEEEWRKYGE